MSPRETDATFTAEALARSRSVAAFRQEHVEIRGQRLGLNQDLLTLLRTALLATDQDEFTAEDLENTLLPSDEIARAQLAHDVTDFAARIKRTAKTGLDGDPATLRMTVLTSSCFRADINRSTNNHDSELAGWNKMVPE